MTIILRYKLPFSRCERFHKVFLVTLGGISAALYEQSCAHNFVLFVTEFFALTKYFVEPTTYCGISGKVHYLNKISC